jgi:hypothetical protein
MSLTSLLKDANWNPGALFANSPNNNSNLTVEEITPEEVTSFGDIYSTTPFPPNVVDYPSGIGYSDPVSAGPDHRPPVFTYPLAS